VGIWRVAGSPLLQTKSLRALDFFKCASVVDELLVSFLFFSFSFLFFLFLCA